jgi:hypothetical protein
MRYECVKITWAFFFYYGIITWAYFWEAYRNLAVKYYGMKIYGRVEDQIRHSWTRY